MTRFKLIDGEHVPFTPEEEAARDAEEAAYLAKQAREGVMAQILALEARITERRTREAILGVDGGWLADLNSQIAELRAELIPG